MTSPFELYINGIFLNACLLDELRDAAGFSLRTNQLSPKNHNE
jgi:hypothetical protein